MNLRSIEKRTPRKKLKSSVLSTILAFSTLSAQADELPNVVLIVADDLGYADVSFTMDYALSMRTSDYLGKPWNPEPFAEVDTPNIDRLAQQAVVFTNGYVNGNVCSPTRAGLMLGRYQQRVGVYSAGTGGAGMPIYEMPENSESGLDYPRINPILPEFLKQSEDPMRNYVSGAFGKWHLGLDGAVTIRNGGRMKNMPFDYISIGDGYEVPKLEAPITNMKAGQRFDPTWKKGSPWHALNRGFDHFFYFMGRGAHDFWDPNGIYDDQDSAHPFRRTQGWDPRHNPGASENEDDKLAPDATWESGSAPYRIHRERIPENYLTVRITEAVCDFIQEQAKTPQPFLAYVPYNAPHGPLQTPIHMDPQTGVLDPMGKNDRRYNVLDDAGNPIAPVTEAVIADWFDPRTPDPNWFPDPIFLYETYKDNPDAFRFFGGSDVPKRREAAMRNRSRTLAMNMWMDKGIGQIVQSLKDPNGDGDTSDSVYENTIFMFTSDNGGTGGGGSSNAPLSGGKHSNLEGGIRVPFFLSWPKMLKEQNGTTLNDLGDTVAKQKLIHAPVMAFDILPTLLEITGEEPLKPDPLLNAETRAFYDYTPDGKSLLPLIRGDVDAIHDYLFWAELKKSSSAGAVRRDKWKLSISDSGSTKLFDLDKDIAEAQDLSAQNPEVVEDMKQAYIEFMNTMAKSFRQPVPNKLLPKNL
ncbi:MAG: sulfatase-like hydrolase/transferase [Verrucomicrobiota bacterium]